MKNILSTFLTLGLCASAGTTFGNSNGNNPADEAPILHAWSWSLNNIADNMRNIAESGYGYVQTSPVQACYVGDNGGMALFSTPGDTVQGKWYYYYQPTDWTIGNYMLGTRDDFRNMCDSAYKYNVKVLVDVLPNHTAIDHHAVLPGLDNAVGGHDNLYHANGFTPITDYNDRLQCTTGEMGGLPDVNTENPDFQYYYLQYVNDLINLGARGFRYDTAKHIGLPSDPLDPKATVNDFWDVALGRKGVKNLTLLMPDSLFVYGEVLQDKNVKEGEYAQYMDLTASSYGHALRDALHNGSATFVDFSDWRHSVDPAHLVTWVESHDTYCNAHESASLTNDQIRAAWVFLAARGGASHPLFYSRPAGSSPDNVWGENRIGAVGNSEYMHPATVAANRFRTKMAGQPEKITASANGQVAMIQRGNKGVAIVNFAQKPVQTKIETALPDGEYVDVISNEKFKVKKGIASLSLLPLQTVISYASDAK